MELTEREHTVITNIWDDETPQDIREIDQTQLIAMHDQVSRAVPASFEDEDTESFSLLIPIERNILTVLEEWN